jgi:hypothetical protein
MAAGYSPVAVFLCVGVSLAALNQTSFAARPLLLDPDFDLVIKSKSE